jgi:hypothetical protein
MIGAGTPKSSWDSCEAIRPMDQSPPLSNGRLHKSDAAQDQLQAVFSTHHIWTDLSR